MRTIIRRVTIDDAGKLVAREDRNGNRDTFSYDGEGRLVQVKGNSGGEFFYSYNAERNLICVRDHTGREVCLRFRYGKLYQFVNSCGFTYTYTYNENGKLESIITPRGIVGLKNTYDSADRVIKQEMPDGSVAELMYDDETNRTYEMQRNGNMVIYESDERFRNVKTIYEDGEEIYEYNDQNLVTLFVDKNGNKTGYSYDGKGNLTEIKDALGRRRSFTYNGDGQLLTESMEGRRLRTNTYNEKGLLIKTEDALGRSREIMYNEKGQPEKIVQPDNSCLNISYDGRGNILEVTDFYGNTVRYVYDALNRVEESADNEGNRIRYNYDERNHLLAVTNPLGNSIRFGYNASGKLEMIIDFDGGIQKMEYNDLGKPEQLIDKEGRNLKWEYDAMGNLEQVIFPTGAAYAYTADGRIESIRYEDGSQAEFTYNPLGQLSMIRDWLGETKIERDCYGKPERITDYNGQTVGYEWGKFGEKTGMIYPDGTKVQWEYDKFLRPIEFTRSVAENGNLGKFSGSDNQIRISSQYNGEGRLTDRKSSGGYHTTWEYDERGRLETFTHKCQETILENYQYGYNAMEDKIYIRKDRSGLPKESGTFQYYYDALQRLTGVEKDGKILHSYSYDSFGNRIEFKDYEHGEERRYHYNNLNYLVEENWRKADSQDVIVNKTYRYDLRGNLMEEHQDGELLHTYEFNVANRMERAVLADGNTASYMYNGTGQRVWRESRQNFYWDFKAVAMDETGKPPSYYLNDEKGSPLRLLYGNGNGCTYGYDEFGNDLHRNEDSDSQKLRKQPFGYLGYRYDEVSGTYFAQAREYRCDSGRFISKDKEKFATVGDPLSHDLFSAYRNSPLNYIDDSGNEVLVISGGNDDKSKFDYMFIETALTKIRDEIDSGTPSEDIAWIVFNAGYEESQMESFRQTADNLDVNFVEVNDKDEFISYINYKDKDEKSDETKRSEDQITSVTVFSHGESPAYANVEENQLSFAYNVEAVEAIADQINFTQSDIAQLHENAFNLALTIFFSCNAGTNDSNGQSFAQVWSNKTGGISAGIKNGRTEYSYINSCLYPLINGSGVIDAPVYNMLGDIWNRVWKTSLWQDKRNRSKERDKNGYSELGSLNYPLLNSFWGDIDIWLRGGFDRGLRFFTPEGRCSVD